MMPLIALVTLINGVCSAGVTFHTTCHPTMQASANTVRCERNSGGATMPRYTNAIAPMIAKIGPATLLFGSGLTAATVLGAAVFGSGGSGAGGLGGGGHS